MPIISIEGMNGTGKTTLTNFLAEKLKEDGYNTEYAKLPGHEGITVCEKVRDILNTEDLKSNYAELFLFLTDMSEFYANLDPMKLYILDRSYLSTMTYQSLQGIPMNFIRQCITNTLFFTDFLIMLTADPTVAWNRVQSRNKKTGNPGGYAEKDIDYYDKVQKRYHLCLSHFNIPYKTIDTTNLTQMETSEKGYQIIREYLGLQ